VVNKCNKKLGMIKRTIGFNAPVNVSKTLYLALVRSDLEYASSVWSGTSKHNMQLIEGVQRRATKYILNYPDMDYKERLDKLNLLPLAYRREISDLNLFFRCKHSLYDMSLDNFVVFNIHGKDHPTTRSDSHKLIPQKCNTESHQSSYFHRIVPIWNQLPIDVRSTPSLNMFKCQVNELYTSLFTSQFDPANTCTWVSNCRCSNCRVM